MSWSATCLDVALQGQFGQDLIAICPGPDSNFVMCVLFRKRPTTSTWMTVGRSVRHYTLATRATHCIRQMQSPEKRALMLFYCYCSSRKCNCNRSQNGSPCCGRRVVRRTDHGMPGVQEQRAMQCATLRARVLRWVRCYLPHTSPTPPLSLLSLSLPLSPSLSLARAGSLNMLHAWFYLYADAYAPCAHDVSA